jgi:hypothetical protein
MSDRQNGVGKGIGGRFLFPAVVLATGFHLYRGEVSHAVVTIILLTLAAFVVLGQVFQSSIVRTPDPSP